MSCPGIQDHCSVLSHFTKKVVLLWQVSLPYITSPDFLKVTRERFSFDYKLKTKSRKPRTIILMYALSYFCLAPIYLGEKNPICRICPFYLLNNYYIIKILSSTLPMFMRNPASYGFVEELKISSWTKQTNIQVSRNTRVRQSSLGVSHARSICWLLPSFHLKIELHHL